MAINLLALHSGDAYGKDVDNGQVGIGVCGAGKVDDTHVDDLVGIGQNQVGYFAL